MWRMHSSEETLRVAGQRDRMEYSLHQRQKAKKVETEAQGELEARGLDRDTCAARLSLAACTAQSAGLWRGQRRAGEGPALSIDSRFFPAADVSRRESITSWNQLTLFQIKRAKETLDKLFPACGTLIFASSSLSSSSVQKSPFRQDWPTKQQDLLLASKAGHDRFAWRPLLAGAAIATAT